MTDANSESREHDDFTTCCFHTLHILFVCVYVVGYDRWTYYTRWTQAVVGRRVYGLKYEVSVER